MKINSYIRGFRKFMSMNRQQFADFIGVKKRTIVSWELGEREPKRTTLNWIKHLKKAQKIRKD